MPWTFPSSPSRRSLLVTAAGAALLTGCSAADRSPGRPDAPLEPRMREAAVRESQGMLERYDATLAAHPTLAERLAPLRAAVAAHVTALRPDGAPPTPAPAGSPGAAGAPKGASASPVPSASPVQVPDQPAKALTALADAERSLAESRTQALADAPGELARLLASVAACGVVHHHLLTSNPGGQE
ncbi:hypothetical protein [Streptomyces bambusae]|uniref:Lipoprotein n=1 Tax=Streptomyces bambusae TaxID=1550616 RepID=A0ABS6ZGJ2_9ACTN|nr:hypothetical protein [Streptomyces bambusae]MBW5486872.1 hypothetical protein [Streptomyces bambusae]